MMLDQFIQIDVRGTLFGMTVRIIVYCAVGNGESKSLCYPSPSSSLHQWIIQLWPKLQMLRVRKHICLMASLMTSCKPCTTKWPHWTGGSFMCACTICQRCLHLYLFIHGYSLLPMLNVHGLLWPGERWTSSTNGLFGVQCLPWIHHHQHPKCSWALLQNAPGIFAPTFTWKITQM